MSISPKINCLITGAGGFVGQALAAALLSDPAIASITLTDIAAPPIPSPTPPNPQQNVTTHSVAADLTSLSTCKTLFTESINLIYLFHGIMSSAAESNLELGLKVNLDSTRLILDHLRETNPGAMVIFAGSTAVYGPPPSKDYQISERDAPNPQGSYGAQKHMCETLLDDYSRRGLLDGRVCRLPTVTVRPGKPTGAASSFASGIFREPLAGLKAVLPVKRETELWICSPRTVVRNLVLARDVPRERFGRSRIVNLPGVTVTVEDMLGALREVGGERARDLVVERRDEAVEGIVESWPPRFDVGRAKALGFVEDGTLERTVRDYLEDYGGNGS